MAELLTFPAHRVVVSAEVSDAAERERALDVRASWVVEAPAGSGKTGLLIQRYLKLLADESVETPEQVLAVTFTTKATGEMRDRVLGQLRAAAEGLAPEKEFDRLTRPLAEAALRRNGAEGWGLLEEPRRLNIRTIDSVCAEITRALPVLSGSGGRLAPTLNSDPLYQEAARRTLGQLGGDDAALSGALAMLLRHRDGNLADCERLIAEMLRWRDQWGELVPLSGARLEDAVLDGEVLPRLERALDLAICQALTQLTRSIAGADLLALTEAAAELAYLDGYNGAPSPIAFCAGKNVPPEDRAEHLAHWRALVHLVLTKEGTWRKNFYKNALKLDTVKPHWQTLKDIVEPLRGNEELLQAMCRLDKLPPAQYPPEQWAVAKALFRVLARALAELQVVFAELGACDFAELGLAARAALGHEQGAGDLEAALGVRTRHLVVDEMQDTSTSQYELIERLTRGWDGHSQTVFLVGDPKQSIYRFRQARVERFVRVLHEERLGDLRLGALRLTANFRSQPRLVGECNSMFSQVFPPQVNLAHPEEVPFVEARAVRGKTAFAGLAWHAEAVAYSPDAIVQRDLRARQRGREARAIREIAMEWLGRPLPAGRSEPWRVAVLVRSRTHLSRIVEEFRRVGDEGAVPFRAVEIEPLGERHEVLDLVALTRALLHPADRVAWFAVLHAPWCGLALSDLHLIAGADDPAMRERCVPDLMEERGHLLSAEGEQRLARVWPVLRAAAEQQGRMRLVERVERTWRTLGGDAYLGAGERENAGRFLRLLDELESAGGRVDLAVLAQRMKKLYAEPAVHPGAVDLMTIHGAKGLEWDVVVIPALERMAPQDRGHLLNWMEIDSPEEGAAHVVLAPIQGTGEDSMELNRWIRGVHATREVAERKRLLYVACTRAREEMHLFASPDSKANGEPNVRSSSLLKTAWSVAEAHVEPAATPEEQEEGETFDLAASVEPELELVEAVGKPPMLYRLPLAFDPAVRFAAAVPLVPGSGTGGAAAAPYTRPEGSFAARAFGNAVHAFLEIAARRIAGGESVETLRVEAAASQPRAAAVLRSAGLAPLVVARGSQRVVAAVEATLDSLEGRWVLAAHPEAASEYALAAHPEAHAGVRLDRMFRAGATPGEPGTDYLWIVDYKTGTHGAAGMETFLEEQRVLYSPQLEAYARTVGDLTARQAEPPMGLRVALFYPSMARLTWWEPAL